MKLGAAIHLPPIYHRPPHQRILRALQSFNPQLLLDKKSLFGGGRLIALLFGQYRESIAIDFFCFKP